MKGVPLVLLIGGCQPTTSPVETRTTIQARCLVDANDDAVDDVLGVKSSTITSFVLLDGRSGKALWEKQVLNDYALHCISPQWFAIDAANGQINLVNTKFLSKATPVLLTGRLVTVAKDDTCLTLTNDKNQELGFDLQTKKITKCAPLLSSAVVSKKQRTITVNKQDYTVLKGERLTILAQENEEVLWSKTFVYKMDDDISFFVAEGILLFVAKKIAEPATTVVVGLDVKTGEAKYTLPSSDPISLIGYNGRYMTLQWGDSVRGLTLLEGKPIWQVGGKDGD